MTGTDRAPPYAAPRADTPHVDASHVDAPAHPAAAGSELRDLPTGVHDGFARLAARLLDAPMAFVWSAGQPRPALIGQFNWPQEGRRSAAALGDLVCRRPDPVGHGDMSADPELSRASFVVGPPYLRLFAGAPLRAEDGATLGAICVAGPTARQAPPPTQLTALAELAELLTQQIGIAGQSRARLGESVTRGAGRLEVEAALRESEDRFRQIADSVPGIIWMTDTQGRITFLSKAFEEYTGKPGEAYYGMTSTHSTHPDDDVTFTPQYEAAAEARCRLTYEYRVRRHDGQYHWHLDTCVPRFDDSGGFLGYIGMLTDVEEMRQLGEQLHQARKMQAVGQLTGGVAHDFNNLLTIILGNAELLSERLAEPRLRRLADATREAAERSASLVQRLLAFSRRQTLRPTVVDINDLIAGMQDLLARTVGGGIDIGYSFAPEAWRVQVDRSQLEAAILNLATNGRDAMPGGGRLTIETANIETAEPALEPELASGPHVMIAVSDAGCGMGQEVLRQAFEPFFTTKDVGQGSGLGLSMVYGFIKQTGGNVALSSKLGMGTTVRIYLPRAVAEPASSNPESPAASAGTGHETILLVEHDPAVCAHVSDQLRELGYRVIEAASGSEALVALGKVPNVALLFAEAIMPGGMNGRQLADEALRRHPELKVLFTAGDSGNGIIHHGLPGSDLLGKPFSRIALARKVRAVLDRRG